MEGMMITIGCNYKDCHKLWTFKADNMDDLREKLIDYCNINCDICKCDNCEEFCCGEHYHYDDDSDEEDPCCKNCKENYPNNE